MSYDKLKFFIQEHKPQLITLLACGVMFVVGFGTGKAFGPSGQNSPEQTNYSANSNIKPLQEGEEAPVKPAKAAPKESPPDDPPVAADASSTVSSTGKDPIAGQPCIIKGNISGSNKIYHIKGGSSYEKTTPEKCFNTEAEAVAAGFRKAKR